MTPLPTLFQISEKDPEPFQVNYLEYFKKYFNWIPEVGKEAILFTTLSENLTGSNQYTSGMVVNIVRLSKNWAIVETAQEYIDKCKINGIYLNKDKYKVPLGSLGMPIKHKV